MATVQTQVTVYAPRPMVESNLFYGNVFGALSMIMSLASNVVSTGLIAFKAWCVFSVPLVMRNTTDQEPA